MAAAPANHVRRQMAVCRNFGARLNFPEPLGISVRENSFFIREKTTSKLVHSTP
jgi:hypothetical protein